MIKTDRLTREQQQLVGAHLGLVGAVLRGLRLSSSLAWEDVIAYGRLGLVEAARRYDPARDVTFGTYAGWWIRATVLLAVRVDAGVKGKYVRVFWHLLSGASDGELAERFRLKEPEVRMLRAAVCAGDLRLDDDAHPLDAIPHDPRRSPEDAAIFRDLCARMRAVIADMPRAMRTVITMRFADNESTLAETGAVFGRSRERARQLENQALKILRKKLEHA